MISFVSSVTSEVVILAVTPSIWMVLRGVASTVNGSTSMITSIIPSEIYCTSVVFRLGMEDFFLPPLVSLLSDVEFEASIL